MDTDFEFSMVLLFCLCVGVFVFSAVTILMYHI